MDVKPKDNTPKGIFFIEVLKGIGVGKQIMTKAVEFAGEQEIKTIILFHFCRIKSCIFCIWLCCCLQTLHGQSILYGVPTVSGVPGSIIRINLVTCEVTTIASNLPPGNFTDFVLMPDGNIYLLGFNNSTPAILLLNTTTNTTTVLATIPGPQACGGGMLPLDPNTILITSTDVICTFNIVSGALTVLGNIAGFTGFGEMFEYNGEIYTTQSGCGNYPSGTYILNLNPVSLTPATLPGFPSFPITSVCNQVITPSPGLNEYNMSNGTINPLCSPYYPGIGSGFQSTAPDPFNSTGPLCDCTTESGNWSNTPSSISVCGNQPITVPHLNDEVLDSDDNLVFILSTNFNPSHIPSNILGVYPTPVIPFTPGLTQYNQLYRVYAVAGNALGTGVDYNDPCLEISNDYDIKWRAAPTVTFLASNNNCSTGCQTVTAQFTGEPPFTLTYQTLIGSVVQSTLTQVFNTNMATIEVCPPAGYTGLLEVKSTYLVDNNCTCSP